MDPKVFSLADSVVFGGNVVDSILTVHNYVGSLKGMQFPKEAAVSLQMLSSKDLLAEA
jgi:hypothetical protein